MFSSLGVMVVIEKVCVLLVFGVGLGSFDSRVVSIVVFSVRVIVR